MNSNENITFNIWKTLSILSLVIFTIVFLRSCTKEKSENSSHILLEKPKISSELLSLEKAYKKKLGLISDLKSTDPKTYWFIVSWLGTNYRTPQWDGYHSKDWKEKTKIRGIDCSGFARVMQDKIFKKKIRGGSQGILNRYCKAKKKKDLIMGDLVFFRSRGSKNDRITHVGVYLTDGYFVHATSRRSAAKGLGLNISSLKKKIWSEDFVTGGEVRK